MTLILSVHSGPHDSAAALFDDYTLIAAIHQERLSRKKTDGGYPSDAIKEVLRIGGITKADVEQLVFSHGSYPVRWLKFSPLKRLKFAFHRKKGRERHKSLGSHIFNTKSAQAEDVWLHEKFLRQEKFPLNTPIYFANHHHAHALSAFFYNPKWENALLYTADGGGDGVFYSARLFKDKKIECLFGDEPAPNHINSLGLAYGYCTKICGFKMNRHEGKLTGLAAFGEAVLADKIGALFHIEEDGQISTNFTTSSEMEKALIDICKDHKREDIAASIQQVLEDYITEAVARLLRKHNVSNLALAGGVFANVRLNACLHALEEVKELFIFPAMGDDGLVVGGALEYLMQRDGQASWLTHRQTLKNVYLGASYANTADAVFTSDKRIEALTDNPVETSAKWLSKGHVGAIFSERMEYGPRALGARTILASPANADVNQTINERLNRSEFMPFAPFILESDARNVFEVNDGNHYACRFMTITVQVNKEWRDKIPAVVHVDNTARPQIISRADNPLYADILEAFKQESGLPVLVNTSFNAHEEPIINTPQEALNALLDNRVDFLVTDKATYRVRQTG